VRRTDPSARLPSSCVVADPRSGWTVPLRPEEWTSFPECEELMSRFTEP
jgi:hypothetical protein